MAIIQRRNNEKSWTILDIKRLENCHLWQQKVITKGDLDFVVIDRIINSSHFDRFTVKCKRCGQLYLYEFVEVGKWGGGDVIHTAFIPIDEKDIEELKDKSSIELFAISPRLQWENDNIYWIGKWFSSLRNKGRWKREEHWITNDYISRSSRLHKALLPGLA